VQQAETIKKINPRTKVWVYRNLVKALPWYSSIREKLSDPAYSGWFLHFSAKVAPHVPKCDTDFDPPKCSELYHDQVQTPKHPHGDGSCVDPCDCGGVPCGEYLWDHRNASLRAWLVNEHMTGASSIESPHIDGIFIDDNWGARPSEEDKRSVIDMGLSEQDVADIKGNWTLTMQQTMQAVLDKGGFNWQLFHPGSGTCDEAPFKGKAECAAYLRKHCVANDTLQHSALMYGLNGDYGPGPHMPPGGATGPAPPDFEQNLASFLLVRGPYAWLGYSWLNCNSTNVPPRPRALDMDYGEPVEACSETAQGSGVFKRKWTKAEVSVDCNTWVGSVKMTEGPAVGQDVISV